MSEKELKPVKYKIWLIRLKKERIRWNDKIINVFTYKTDPINIEVGTVLYHMIAYPWLPIAYRTVNTKKEAIEYIKHLIDARTK